MRCGLRRLVDDHQEVDGGQFEVLLLGSTPELRDMLAEFPMIRLTLIDYDFAMTKAMTELMATDGLAETWIEGDWLTVPLPALHYDAVLSDLVLGNLEPERQVELIRRVHGLLKASGRWLNRADCVDERSAFVGLETLLAYYASLREPSEEDICALRSVAGLQYWDASSGFHSYAALGAALKEYRDGDNFTHPNPKVNDILARLWKVCIPFGRPYWLLRYEALVADFNRYFRIEREIRSDWHGPYQGRGYYFFDLAPKHPLA